MPGNFAVVAYYSFPSQHCPLVYYQLNMLYFKLVGNKSSYMVSLAGGLLFQVVCKECLLKISKSHQVFAHSHSK